MQTKTIIEVALLIPSLVLLVVIASAPISGEWDWDVFSIALSGYFLTVSGYFIIGLISKFRNRKQ